MNKNQSLTERIELCREFCIETSKLAGTTKATKELLENMKDPEGRYYFKLLLECQFKQLIIKLFILTQDTYSTIRINSIVREFEKQYRIRLSELGLPVDLKKEKQYRKELVPHLEKWKSIRHNYAAHTNTEENDEWNVDIDTISIFLESARNIINTINRTLAVPLTYPKDTKFVTYSIQGAVNLEEESYRAVKQNLGWRGIK